MSSHPEQLSSSEQEKITVYRNQTPNYDLLLAELFRNPKKRSNSAVYNKRLRDIERRLFLVNRPFMPKYIKHKKYRSENASEVSEVDNEENYYKDLHKEKEEPAEEEYPEYILDTNIVPPEDTKTKHTDRDSSRIRNPNFVTTKSPSLRDCDVTRPIKKPTGKLKCPR